MNKVYLRYAAILAFFIALVFTGLGGLSNMLGKDFIFTEQHAWNDGLFMILVAIFLLMLSIV
jgi:hypothetical protein